MFKNIKFVSSLSCSLCFVLSAVSLCSFVMPSLSPHHPTGNGRWLPFPEPGPGGGFFLLKGSSSSSPSNCSQGKEIFGVLNVKLCKKCPKTTVAVKFQYQYIHKNKHFQ